MEAGLFSSENMLIDGSGTFKELDICRARSESRLWEESWRVVGFFSPLITLGSESGSDIGFFQIMASALGPELCEILCVP